MVFRKILSGHIAAAGYSFCNRGQPGLIKLRIVE